MSDLTPQSEQEINQNEIDENYINENVDKEIDAVRYATQVYDIDGLIRRLQDNDLVVPQFRSDTESLETEGFQREFVWKKQQMDRFIESILVGFPVPGIFLVEQSDQRLLVLDGQQRLTTLKFFREGEIQRKDSTGKLVKSPFILRYVSDEFAGKSYADLPLDLQRKFKNTGITSTIVRTVPEPGNLNTIYQIFERINSGGTKLTPHQIRIATFAGQIVTFIEEINSNEDWRYLYGKYDVNAKDHENISRILSLYAGWEGYSAPMKDFINDFYKKNSTSCPSDFLNQAKDKFLSVASLLKEFYPQGWSKDESIAYVDSMFVGLMKRIDSGKPLPSIEQLTKLSDSFNHELDWSAVSRNGSDRHYVLQRMRAAIDVFQ